MTDAEQMREDAAEIIAGVCLKCGGAGWLWAHELDEYPGTPTGSADDTKYSCDSDWCQLAADIRALQLPTPPAETPLVEWRCREAWIGSEHVGGVDYFSHLVSEHIGAGYSFAWHFNGLWRRDAGTSEPAARLALEKEAARVIAAMGLVKI